MKTGIIMEINERFLTLLTPEGEFLKAQKLNRQYQIGEEIDFYPIRDEKTQSGSLFSILSSFKAKAVLATAVMIMLVCSSLFTINGNNEVYAYMSIDINPSIELGVNDKFQVIEILPYNKEGEEIVKQIPDWKKKSVKLVTSQLIEKVKAQGYIKENYEIVITTVHLQKESKALETKWEKEITEIKKDIQKEQLDVKVMDASPKEREQAKEQGVSLGSYKEAQLKKVPNNNSSLHKNNKNDNKKSNPKGSSNNKENNGQFENNHSKTPPGQLNKEQHSNDINHLEKQGKQPVDKKIPPGQQKKQERMEHNNNRSDQENEKKSNNGQKVNNKNKKSSEDQNNGKDHPKKNGQEIQNKENQNKEKHNQNKGKQNQNKEKHNQNKEKEKGIEKNNNK